MSSEKIKAIFEVTPEGFDQVDKKTRGLSKNVKKVDQETTKFNKSLEKTKESIKAAFAVGVVAAFTKKIISVGLDMVNLAGEAKGVEEAFLRVSSKSGLVELRAAVKGTVDDVKLMQNTVMASNFGIPAQELTTLYEFAAKRAQETGQDIDYLVDSVVTGIGRKSPLILDNLGISATHLREKLNGVGIETASVADLTEIIGDIARDSLGEMGELTDTAAVKFQQLDAEMQNLKVDIGESLTPAVFDLLEVVNAAAKGFSLWYTGEGKEIGGMAVEAEVFLKDIDRLNRLIEENQRIVDAYESGAGARGMRDLGKTYQQATKDLKAYQQELKKLKADDIAAAKDEAPEAPEAPGDTPKPATIENLQKQTKILQKQVDLKKAQIAADKEAWEDAGENAEKYEQDRINAIIEYNSKRQEIKDFIAETQEDEIDKIKEKYQKILEMEETTAAERKAIQKAMDDEVADYKTAKMEEATNKISSYISQGWSQISGVVNTAIAMQTEATNRRYEAERKQIQDSTKSEKQKEKLLEKLEKQKRKAQHETAIKKWRMSLLESIANTAAAVAKALPNVPLSIMVGKMGALQTGIIAANKPEKFEDGGVFDGTGIVPGTQYTGDNVNANLNSGEGVLNQQQGSNIMREVFRLANGGQVNNTTNNSPRITIGAPVYNINAEVSEQSLARIENLNNNFVEDVVEAVQNAQQNNMFDANIVNVAAEVI